MQLRIDHQVEVLTNPITIECALNCPDCEAATKINQFLDPGCLPYIWIPARHTAIAKESNGTIDRKKAMRAFLKELECL